MFARLFIAALAVALILQENAPAEGPVEYTCQWHLIGECGVGHPGGVEFVEEDDRGNIWTTAANCFSSSIWQYDGSTWQRRFKFGGRGSAVWSAACDRISGDMYFATKQGLLQLTGDQWSLHPEIRVIAGFGPSTFHFTDQSECKAAPTTFAFCDQVSDLWASAPTIGIFRKTGRESSDATVGRVWHKHTTYFPSEGMNTTLSSLLETETVTCMHAMEENQLLVGTEGGSLHVLWVEDSGYGAGTNIRLQASHSPNDIGIRRGTRVNAVTSDAQGDIWLAYGSDGSGGVARCHDDDWRIYNDTSSALPNRPCTTLAHLGDGRFWCGVNWRDPSVWGAPAGVDYDKTGILEFDGTQWRYVQCEGFRAGTRVTNECYRWINCIKLDSRGHIWVGTQGGLAQFSPLNERPRPADSSRAR